MSHIFDGLQRSEGECSDVDLSALSGVTELLQHAERRVTSRWESGISFTQSDEAKDVSGVTSLDLKRAPSAATVHDAPVIVTEPTRNDESADLVDKFSSLPVLPP